MKRYSSYLTEFPAVWPFVNQHTVAISKQEVDEASQRILQVMPEHAYEGSRLLLWALQNVKQPNTLLPLFLTLLYGRLKGSFFRMRPDRRHIELNENIPQEIEKNDLKDLKKTYSALFNDIVELSVLSKLRGGPRARALRKIKERINSMSEEEKDLLGYINMGKGVDE